MNSSNSIFNCDGEWRTRHFSKFVRVREPFKSKVNPWHPHGNDRWCGRWNQEET